MNSLRHDRRIRQLIAAVWAPYMGLAILVWGVELACSVVIMKEYFPQVDVESLNCIVVAMPLVLLAVWLNFFVATVLFIRAFVQKKGRDKAMRYLFPASDNDQRGILSRMLLKASGL